MQNINEGQFTEMRFSGFLKKNAYTFKRVRVGFSSDVILQAALTHMGSKVNKCMRNQGLTLSDLAQKSPETLLDWFFNTDYIVKVDGTFIAIDVSCKSNVNALIHKEESMKISMRFLKTIGIKKGLVISFNNPNEDTIFNILDAIEDANEVSTVLI